jgi:hypothetical protein
MAEVGNMGLPPKLLARGVKDMVRVSDARMTGTAYGTGNYRKTLRVNPNKLRG